MFWKDQKISIHILLIEENNGLMSYSIKMFLLITLFLVTINNTIYFLLLYIMFYGLIIYILKRISKSPLMTHLMYILINNQSKMHLIKRNQIKDFIIIFLIIFLRIYLSILECILNLLLNPINKNNLNNISENNRWMI